MELVVSDDGSHTLKIPALKEHYHSHRGALRESEHVFLRMGLDQFPSVSNVRILEVGFGTGLNALLTGLRKGKRTVHYTTLEPNPVEDEVIKVLNYTTIVPEKNAEKIFSSIHNAEWDDLSLVIDGFTIQKLQCKLEDFIAEQPLDLVYYDAFAPHAQPELWEPIIWQRLFAMMKDGGILVTYCAKGQVRRDMQGAGFTVERLPGPPGKREMIRATKPIVK